MTSDTTTITQAAAIPDGADVTIGDDAPFAAGPPLTANFTRTAPRGKPTDTPPDISLSGVDYDTGESTASASILGPDLPGMSYASQLAESGELGSGWLLDNLPYLSHAGTAFVSVVLGPTETYAFQQQTDGSYQGLYGIKETLATRTVSGNQQYLFTTTDGTVYAFNGFGYDASSTLNGQLSGIFQPDGGHGRGRPNRAPGPQGPGSARWTITPAATPRSPIAANCSASTSTGPNAAYISSILVKGWNGSCHESPRGASISRTTMARPPTGCPAASSRATEYAADLSGSLAFAGMYYFRYSATFGIYVSPAGRGPTPWAAGLARTIRSRSACYCHDRRHAQPLGILFIRLRIRRVGGRETRRKRHRPAVYAIIPIRTTPT